MPALGSALLPNALHAEAAVHNASVNGTTKNALQVICAWPVSGQYGPGTRVLYYVLIAACVFARKTEWLRNACLAAVLLFPAVAALHGVVLAALNLHGAVDMDIYGAFQLCSIGILTGPVAVRVSRTYFYDPGRNIIFLWTTLILAGLLSLTVEFFRIQPTACPFDDAGNPISSDPRKFKYNTSCGMTCSEDKGPFSPMRNGAASNIYVIPAPDKITFGTATLMAAACCVPAILSLISMWNKILEINRMNRFGIGKQEEKVDEPIEGTNGATIKKMNKVNSLIRMFLSAVEIPVFAAAVMGILILGEMNFFSSQVLYQTEPVASIGQWGPIVGAGLAVLGSLYLVLAADLHAVEEAEQPKASSNQDNCSMREINTIASVESLRSPARGVEMQRSASNTRSIVEHDGQPRQSSARDSGNRRKVAIALTKFVIYLSDAAHERLNDSEFKSGKALDFPEIPGELRRNRALPNIRNQYNTYRDTYGNASPSLRGRASRAGSFTSSIYGLDLEASSRFSRPGSRSPSPTIISRTSHANTITGDRAPPEIHNRPRASSGGVNGNHRRATLEVPIQTHHGSPRSNPSGSPTSPTNSNRPIPDIRRPPAIVVSSENEDATPVHRTSQSPSSPSSPSPISTPSAVASSPSSPRHIRQFTL
ncbi:hypothetical protein I7I50_03207 [Histoplasma capsulatum G186AR]|uniref:Uncharacterized protein n=1 Tax=Ajellomyces capsulatus TaxID=5037 RepID=A0A8H8D5E4_AJECA|nr:hypothetical protein I7I52_00123 [Histoplasma capsulatum]QSS72135.1 hypothetical protein I7I50_03207 [Histoplasma capsulatum G186AR]